MGLQGHLINWTEYIQVHHGDANVNLAILETSVPDLDRKIHVVLGLLGLDPDP